MINQGFYSATPTKLDLNGPYMSFTSLPEGISGNPGDTVNLVGVATASFLGAGATTINDGNVAYRWYEVGVGALSDGNRLSGTNTNTLTLTDLQSPRDSNRKFYLEAKYESTAYENRSSGKNGNHISPANSDPAAAEVEVPRVTASISASSTNISYDGSVTITWRTTNADSVTSNFGSIPKNGSKTFSNQTSSRTFRITASNSAGSKSASVRVNVATAPPPPTPDPEIIITSQPSSRSATFNRCTGSGGSVNFSVGASVNDPNGSTLQYQWYLNDSALSNGTNVSGAQSSTLTLKVLENQKGNNNVYVRVSYSGATTKQSSTANYSVTVIDPTPSLSITSQPTNQSVFVGETATFSVGASISDGRPVSYQWYKNGSAISGATSSSLSITPSSAGSDNYYVIVSDSSTTCTAVPSSIQSNTVTLTANEISSIIRVGRRSDDATSISYADVDLNVFSFGNSGSWEIYSPFNDIEVDVKIEAAAGRTITGPGGGSGGKGGQAVVRFTLRQNNEYIIKTIGNGSGGGGGGVFIYDKARLIACVGGGGGAGTAGNGGDGGGVGLNGNSGSGGTGGIGGIGGAATLGFFPGGDSFCEANPGVTGGRVSRCTIGDPSCVGPRFWQNNYSPCGNYGNSALNVDGSPISGSALISRGFKGGIAHRNNGGVPRLPGVEGGGGSGATGGGAANPPGTRFFKNSGGGGASGYNGGVTVIQNRSGGRTATNGQFAIALAGRGLSL